MNILHTSDWHLGKRLEGRDRLDEQREAVDRMAEIAAAKDCRIVLVAGDLFDVATPPAEAETLYYYALRRLSEDGRLVLVVSGNHDDPVRVSCASCLLSLHNVLVCPPEGFAPEEPRLERFAVLGKDARSILLEGYGERLRLTCLSFPFSYGAGSADKSYTDNLRELAATELAPGERNLLVAHLFAAGASPTGEERAVEVGGLRTADAALFEGYDYVALGHIHRRQNVKNGCYSGSILPYAFDETNEKGVVVYDTASGERTFVPLNAGKRLVRLVAEDAEQALDLLEAHADCLCELTLRLNRPLSFSEHKVLRRQEALAALKIELAEEGREEERNYRELSPEQLFAAYWKSRYGGDPDGEVVAEFLSLLYGEEEKV